MEKLVSSSKNTSISKISVDNFYEKQKELYDICGNLINKEKFPFVNILSKYLTDIVGLIDIEVKNSARNSMINWREKKNPKLLSRLINSDDNINLINMSMNKITSGNYSNIANEITEALLNDNYRKLPDYCAFLFDVVIKKCMIDEAFAKDYIRFLFEFKGDIVNHLSENINKFITEAVGFLTSKQSLKEYGYFHYVKEAIQWQNVGVIFANIFTFTKSLAGASGISLSDSINQINIVDNLSSQFEVLFSILDWLPADMNDLYGRLFMVFAVMEILINEVWCQFSDKSRALFSEILSLVYNCGNIPNKIKFKVLDLQDFIKNFKPAKVPVYAPASVANNIQTNLTVVVKAAIADISPKLESDATFANINTKQVNIWETRKQQQIHMPMPVPKQSQSTLSHVNKGDEKATLGGSCASTGAGPSRNRNRNRNGHGNYNNHHIDRNSSSGNKRINEGDRNRNVEELPKSKNMFSGLESGDSNDEYLNNNTDKNKNKPLDGDDDFITVEKKVKNVYKPKKTPALAIEGNKIYSGTSNYPRRK